MRLTVRELARKLDEVDLTTVTTAKVTAPPYWAETGQLEIPFDRELTQAEVDAVTLLLTTADDAQMAARKACLAYRKITTPTSAQNAAQIKVLTDLVLAVMDRKR